MPRPSADSEVTAASAKRWRVATMCCRRTATRRDAQSVAFNLQRRAGVRAAALMQSLRIERRLPSRIASRALPPPSRIDFRLGTQGEFKVDTVPVGYGHHEHQDIGQLRRYV